MSNGSSPIKPNANPPQPRPAAPQAPAKAPEPLRKDISGPRKGCNSCKRNRPTP